LKTTLQKEPKHIQNVPVCPKLQGILIAIVLQGNIIIIY